MSTAEQERNSSTKRAEVIQDKVVDSRDLEQRAQLEKLTEIQREHLKLTANQTMAEVSVTRKINQKGRKKSHNKHLSLNHHDTTLFISYFLHEEGKRHLQLQNYDKDHTVCMPLTTISTVTSHPFLGFRLTRELENFTTTEVYIHPGGMPQVWI